MQTSTIESAAGLAERRTQTADSASQIAPVSVAAPVTVASPPARVFRAPRPNFPLMRALGVISRWLLVRGYFRVKAVDFPTADRERLARAVNPSTAAFLAPNHPEFGFDWMMDKELSTMVAPRVASWASHAIIESAPRFWGQNNLIANNGGEAAAAYSVAWALEGNGVLLHPEGMVHWTANKVHSLFPGVAEMACDAAREIERRGAIRPVYIAPVVWKVRFTGDVTRAMHREMALIERALSLPAGDDSNIPARFLAVQEHTLARQMKHFGADASLIAGLDFFNAQDAFRAYLVADLQARYRVQLAESMDRTVYRLDRAILGARKAKPDDPTIAADVRRVHEAARLGGFTRDVYGTPTLSQEQIFESLKRLRADLVRGGFRNALHNALPTPYGRRVVHVRVPEPIAIDPERANDEPRARAEYQAEVLQETRRRMQTALDSINSEIVGETMVFAHPNPF